MAQIRIRTSLRGPRATLDDHKELCDEGDVDHVPVEDTGGPEVKAPAPTLDLTYPLSTAAQESHSPSVNTRHAARGREGGGGFDRRKGGGSNRRSQQMGDPSERTRVSRLRQSLRRLSDETARLVDVFLADEPMARGSVYEMRRKCGKPSCACTRGRLHASKVISWSEGGATRLRAVPKGRFVELRLLTKRYQRFRKARARLVKLHGEMLGLIGQLEAARRVEPSFAVNGADDHVRQEGKVRGCTSEGKKRRKRRKKRSPK